MIRRVIGMTLQQREMKPLSSYVLIVGIAVFLTTCGGNELPKYDRASGSRTYLEHALSVADWIQATATNSSAATIWPDDALRPHEISLGISSGVAGKVIFFLELYRATGDGQYLNDALMGAEYLLEKLPQTRAEVDSMRSPHSFYGGLAGVGFTLSEVYKETNDNRFRGGALVCVDWIHELAQIDGSGASWNSVNDILGGSAGTGLFLLYAARALNHRESLDLAIKAGDILLERAISEHDGLTWKRQEDRDFILPNFSHGAAGVGFFLATLYQESGQQRFFDAAVASAKYLEAIAKTDSDVFLVPYGFPDIGWSMPFDIGWAHGLAGTGRLFHRLWQVDANLDRSFKWLERVRQGANGIQKSGLPNAPSSSEFGDKPFKLDMRFGQASVARFFFNLYQWSHEEQFLVFARNLVDDIIAKGVLNEDGLHWTLDRYRFMPDRGMPASFTGYFYGAAGFGLMLLHLDLVEQGRTLKTVFPDDPFNFLFKTVEFASLDTLKVTADFYDSGDKNDPVVLLFHRSGSGRGQYRKIAPRLTQLGFNCLAVDSRWGGRRDPLNVLDNLTAGRAGTFEILDDFENRKDDRWPILFGSYNDMAASIRWLKENAYHGKKLVLGASISSTFVFKLAIEFQDDIAGVISYSPGEYFQSDSTLVEAWASQVSQRVYMACGSEEEVMSRAIYDVIPHSHKTFFQGSKPGHGSSILLADEGNWRSLKRYLYKFL